MAEKYVKCIEYMYLNTLYPSLLNKNTKIPGENPSNAATCITALQPISGTVYVWSFFQFQRKSQSVLKTLRISDYRPPPPPTPISTPSALIVYI